MIDTPNQTTETLDPERQQKAKQYAQIGRRIFVVELALGAVYVLAWILTGLSPWLRDQLYIMTQATWLAVPLFALGFGLPYLILTAPLSYYSGYVLPHKYQQSVQSFKGWLTDQGSAQRFAGYGCVGLGNSGDYLFLDGGCP